MIITKEMGYALRVLRVLADGEAHTEHHICEDEDIPVHFCYRIARKLADEGLIAIKRGRNGGYHLNCDLREASLLDLIKAVKDKPVLAGCLREGAECKYLDKHDGKCAMRDNLQELQDQMVDSFQHIKLYDLIF